MTSLSRLTGGIAVSALMSLAGAAQAATFVYVSNAEDGNIGTYTMLPDGDLLPGARVEAGKPVMPMSVSLAPWNARGHNNLGYAYQLAGRESDARREYETALFLDPGHRKARFNLLLLRKGLP